MCFLAKAAAAVSKKLFRLRRRHVVIHRVFVKHVLPISSFLSSFLLSFLSLLFFLLSFFFLFSFLLCSSFTFLLFLFFPLLCIPSKCSVRFQDTQLSPTLPSRNKLCPINARWPYFDSSDWKLGRLSFFSSFFSPFSFFSSFFLFLFLFSLSFSLLSSFPLAHSSISNFILSLCMGALFTKILILLERKKTDRERERGRRLAAAQSSEKNVIHSEIFFFCKIQQIFSPRTKFRG